MDQGEETEYRAAEEFFPWFEARTRKRLWSVMAIQFVVITIFLALLNNWHNGITWILVPAVLGLFGAIMAFKIPETIRKATEDYREFHLFVSAQGLRRTQPGLPELSLAAADIQKITLSESDGIVVWGPGRLRLWIPKHMDRHAELELQLGALEPLEQAEPSPKYPMVRYTFMALATLAAIIVIVAIGGLTLLQVMGLITSLVMAFVIKRSPNPNPRALRANLVIAGVMGMFLLLHFLQQAIR